MSYNPKDDWKSDWKITCAYCREEVEALETVRTEPSFSSREALTPEELPEVFDGPFDQIEDSLGHRLCRACYRAMYDLNQAIGGTGQ